MEELKQKAAKRAVKEIQNGQIIGIGSGTTVGYLIENLIEKKKIAESKKEKFQIELVAASKESEEALKKGGFSPKDLNQIPYFDLVIDGTDLVDQQTNLIKGGGGALLREKMLMREARRIVIITDESKIRKKLMDFKLPVEIVPFGAEKTKKKLDFKGEFRRRGKDYYLTDNHNLICDLEIDKEMDLTLLEKKLKQISGVVETGLFLNFHPEILVAYSDGRVEFLKTN